MSEADIESTTAAPAINNRFFCHSCSNEVENAQDFKCPLCFSGFVEMLENTEHQNVAADVDNPEQNTSQPHTPYNLRRVYRQRLSGGPQLARRSGGAPRHMASPMISVGNVSVRPGTAATIIQDVLRISDRLIGSDYLAVGNMGDYAVNRTGLDAIVTQLLNQMDSSGPPPLSDTVIESLPRIAITQEQIQECGQCSICWEPFHVEEMVRKLPCAHIYHDSCIKPWLALRCTCPICRKPVMNTPIDNELDTEDDGDSFIYISSSLSASQTSLSSVTSLMPSQSSSSCDSPIFGRTYSISSVSDDDLEPSSILGASSVDESSSRPISSMSTISRSTSSISAISRSTSSISAISRSTASMSSVSRSTASMSAEDSNDSFDELLINHDPPDSDYMEITSNSSDFDSS